jgi:hypothetical protein
MGIIGVGGGGLSYVVAKFLFSEFIPLDWTPQMKRLAAYVISALLGVAALAAGSYFGYVEVTPDTAFVAATTAFATSQALHGLIDLGKGT